MNQIYFNLFKTKKQEIIYKTYNSDRIYLK